MFFHECVPGCENRPFDARVSRQFINIVQYVGLQKPPAKLFHVFGYGDLIASLPAGENVSRPVPALQLRLEEDIERSSRAISELLFPRCLIEQAEVPHGSGVFAPQNAVAVRNHSRGLLAAKCVLGGFARYLQRTAIARDEIVCQPALNLRVGRAGVRAPVQDIECVSPTDPGCKGSTWMVSTSSRCSE